MTKENENFLENGDKFLETNLAIVVLPGEDGVSNTGALLRRRKDQIIQPQDPGYDDQQR